MGWGLPATIGAYYSKKKSKANESFRPLLRSLIIRELDRIKNGN